MPEQHRLFARMWSRAAPNAMSRDDRRELVDGLHGAVTEVGAGSGLLFALYPPGVDRVTAVEPQPFLRAKAVEAAGRAAVPVVVEDATAERLPVADGSQDAVVFSLVLCSVPDQARALGEARRALRPGGEIRFHEHVIARNRPAASVQRLLDRSGLWPRVGGGCHMARDTLAAIEAAGFDVHDSRRFVAGLPHVAGSARSPAG